MVMSDPMKQTTEAPASHQRIPPETVSDTTTFQGSIKGRLLSREHWGKSAGACRCYFFTRHALAQDSDFGWITNGWKWDFVEGIVATRDG